ncbi:hypothetical protein [Streptomyces sp. SID5643]|uniref:hypothetical protein n=1 Tax=Streptomyces sp. SID5643 TaxID=2690307 RepID=UPI00136BED9B|nr:hypothetical protein [Streptomyces sp. SID5643]MZF83545.1 hypothetical protein [Streptomyces sp. SID5643]
MTPVVRTYVVLVLVLVLVLGPAVCGVGRVLRAHVMDVRVGSRATPHYARGVEGVPGWGGEGFRGVWRPTDGALQPAVTGRRTSC